MTEHRHGAPGGNEDHHHGHAHHHEPSTAPPEPVEVGYPGHPEVPSAGPAGHQAVHPGAGDHRGHDMPAGQEGHDKHAGHSVAMFRDKFWITLALTIPTLIWGHMLPRVLDYTPPAVPGHRWIAPLFGTAVFLYGGLVFLRAPGASSRTDCPV
jgi:P-type Cu2+ transporter